MTMWIVMFSFLMPPSDGFLHEGALRVGSPMRYHGIEKLIMKFERESDATDQ